MLMNKHNKIVLPIIMAAITLFSGCSFLKNSEEKEVTKTMADNKKTIFTFLSAPGAGKGTLAQLAVKNLDFLVLSTGNLFRQHTANKTTIGEELNKYMEKGELVPDELVVEMVREWLIARKNTDRQIILDGFPRTAIQAQKLLEIIQKDLSEHNFRVIKLDIPEEEITERLISRRVCPSKDCQSVYNTSMSEISNGKCPKCGTELIQRKDDQPEVIKQRFDIYNKHEQTLIDFYESEGLKIEKLNVSGKNPNQIFEEFKIIL